MDNTLSYDATPFDGYNNSRQRMAWNRYAPGSRFVYSDSLGRGGATQLRYAQTPRGSSAMMGDEPTGSGQLWQRQLGELPGHAPPCAVGEQEVYGWCWPVDEAPPVGVPVVTEQQCQEREAAAHTAGRRAERSAVVATAAVTALVSGVVGAALAGLLRR